jgi:hypothetical protein
MSTLWIVRRWIGDCTCGVTVRCTTLFKMLLERPEHRTLHCKIGIPVLDGAASCTPTPTPLRKIDHSVQSLLLLQF